MPSECHSTVRAPAARVTRLGPCGELPTSGSNGCDFATTTSIVDITLNKVYQERQDALQLNANGDICVDKPKCPILRWYEVIVTFCNVDPELFNIVSAEPLVLNDATTPVAIGWDTLPDSACASNFALEFWVGTDDEDCNDDTVVYGYGLLPRIVQGTIGNIVINNGNINFTVTGITRGANQWGEGPYNVIINETGANAGFPANLLTAIPAAAHKRFIWTELPPPDGVCGCQDMTPVLAVAPLTGLAAVARVATFPLLNGVPLLPAVIDWGDLTAVQVVTSGTTANHTYAAPGSYTVTYRPTAMSSPTYTSATVVVT
jgi:hypothetical protein